MEFNGSSYPQPTPQQNDPLGTIGKLNTIQQQGLSIDKQKLENFNQKYDIVERGLGNLVNQPDLDGDHFIKTYQNFVKAGVMTPEQAAQEMSSVPTRNGSKSEQDYKERLRKLAETHLLNAQEKKAAIDHYTGQNASVDTGQNIVSGRQGAIRATGQGMAPSPFQQGSYTQRQLPVATPGVNQNNDPSFNPGGNAPVTVQSGGALPVAATAGPTGAAAQDNTFRPAPANQFSEGQKQVNEDLATGSAKLQAMKPAQQALKMMTPEVLSGLTGTGPIGNKVTKAISAVGGVLGLPKGLDDRVAARQEIVKKMNAYVSQSPVAGRSDAAQILAEASSPDPNVQTLKALVGLTRDAIALDRIHAAKSLDFMTDDKGNQVKNPDYSAYPFKRGRFPNAVDEDAFKLDLMSKEERKELQERKEKESPEAQQKFRTSVAMARKLGMY